MKNAFILLIFLSPLIAELFSGSTPFFTFFTPFVFLVFLGFYGTGCLLIREVTAHRELGYASVLLLGAAFGVLEEGIILKSWFDPTWMGGEITSKVLRVYGISVLQPFANITYHAVVSIAAPILLMNSVTSTKLWLRKRELIPFFCIFAISAVIMFFTFNYDYKIRMGHYLMGIVLFGLFVRWGLKGPKIISDTERESELKLKIKSRNSPAKMWVLGFFFTMVLFIIFYTFSNAGAPWFLILGLALLVYYAYRRVFSGVQWTSPRSFAVGAGITTGLLPVVAIMARTDPAKIGNFAAAVLFVFFLVILYKRTLRSHPHIQV